MGRPKPGADIEIGNQRQVPAIRKRQTEAEDHKMQHNKGRRLREGKSESIRIETGSKGEREIFEPASSKQERRRCALACSLGV
jgi:hypothetical protein